MWVLKFNDETKRYYLINYVLEQKRIVKPLTPREIEKDLFDSYYSKAYTQCRYMNGETVYRSRFVNGKRFVYKSRRA